MATVTKKLLLATIGAVVLALTAGCNGDPDKVLYVSNEFTVEEREVIQKAANIWNDTVDAKLDLAFVDSLEGRRLTVKPVTRAELPDAWGLTLGPDMTLNVTECPANNNCLLWLATHEMGHLLGLEHNDAVPTAMMHGAWTGQTELSQDDINAWSARKP